MSGPGPFTVVASGSLTQPATLSPTIGSALTTHLLSEVGKVDFVTFPSIKAVAFCNGYDLQFHAVDSATYITGPLAPYTAPTMASTGTQATGTITFTATVRPANNDIFVMTNPSGTPLDYGAGSFYLAAYFQFIDTLPTSHTDGSAYVYIKRSATAGAPGLAATIASVNAFFAGTAVEGTDYYINSSVATMQGIVSMLGATITSTTATVINFRTTQYGTGGNNQEIQENTDSGASWAVVTFAGGTGGTGTAPLAGTYDYAYAYVRKGDFAQTSISHDAPLTVTSPFNTTASSLQTPATRDGIDLYRLFRTTNTGGVFYRNTDSTSSPITDSALDATLVADATRIYDGSIYRPYEDGRPTKYRYHAEHDGSVFGAGAILSSKQSAGTAAVVQYDGTNAATAGVMTVVLTGAVYPKVSWIGRTFRVTADEIKYGIVDVVESSKTLTLNTPYIGATNATASYEVTDARDPFVLMGCVPLLLNNWPPENEVVGMTANDARGVTGLRSVYGTLLAWTGDGTYRVLGDLDTGLRLLTESGSNGAWCNQAIQDTDGRVVWLGPDGVFAWGHAAYGAAGSSLYGAPTNISRPQTEEPGQTPAGIQSTIARINPLAADGIVSDYNPTLKLVRWFVPVDGSPWNNFVIAWSAQTGAFTFGTCDAVTSATSVIGPDGTYVTIVGDMYGNLWQMDLGYSDGAWGFECVQSVSSYAVATNALTVSGTPFPTASGGLSGVPVYAIEAATGVVKRNTIASNTSSVLTAVSGNWVYPDGTVGSVPAASDQIVVGGLYAHGRTSMFSAGMPEIRKTVSSVTSQFAPTTAGQMWVAVGVDSADPTTYTLLDGTADYADLTASKGTKYGEMRRGPGRLVQIEWWVIAPAFDFRLIGMDSTIRMRDEVPR